MKRCRPYLVQCRCCKKAPDISQQLVGGTVEVPDECKELPFWTMPAISEARVSSRSRLKKDDVLCFVNCVMYEPVSEGADDAFRTYVTSLGHVVEKQYLEKKCKPI